MSSKSPIVIKVISDDADDVTQLNEELKLELGDDAQIELKKEKAPELPGKAIDPTLVIEAIGLVIKAVETALAVAKVLEEYKNRKSGVSYVLENAETGEKIKIGPYDSTKNIAKKIRKITGKPGFLERLFKGKKNKSED
jgi:hypothetical protein